MSRRRLVCIAWRAMLVSVLWGLTWQSRVFAFNGSDTFGVPALAAGGGGKYFTGSLRDGRTCAVCHQSETHFDVTVTGLPPRGYEPGQVYDLDLSWTLGGADSSSGMLEVSGDADGQPAGRLEIPATSNLGADELCGNQPALQRIDFTDGRQLIYLQSCPVERLHVLWTAPSIETGPLWINAAIVRANGDGLETGDSVARVAEFLSVVNVPAVSSWITEDGDCSFSSQPSGPSHHGLFGFAMLGLALSLRRRFVRQRRVASGCATWASRGNGTPDTEVGQ